MGFWVFFSDDRVEYYDSDACALYLSPDRTIEIVDNSKIIFDFMIEHRNVAIYRDQIIAQIDGTGDSQSYNNKRADRGPVDQAIRVLRVKLDKYADCIRTVRGVGYKYVGPPKEDKQLPTSQPNTSNPPPFDAESGVKKEAERNTQIASHSSQHGAMNGSPHTSNGTSVSISIEAAIKRARISISTFEVSQGRSPVGVAVEPLIRDIIDGFIDDLYSDILGISARVWREYAVDQKAQAILMAYVHELNIIRDLTLDNANTRN